MLTEAELKKARIEFEKWLLPRLGGYPINKAGDVYLDTVYVNVNGQWEIWKTGYQAALSSCIADIREATDVLEKCNAKMLGCIRCSSFEGLPNIVSEALSLLSKYREG